MGTSRISSAQVPGEVAAVLVSMSLSSELEGSGGVEVQGFPEGGQPAGTGGVGAGEHDRVLCRCNLQSLMGGG